MNSEADISEIKLQTVTLDYIHALFPMNPLCIGKQSESNVGSVDHATNKLTE